MAGIKVLQHKIFKINTTKLKYYNWDLIISQKEAFNYDEIVPLFQGENFRAIANILDVLPNEVDFTKYMVAIVIDKKQDFKRLTSKKGFKINGIIFKRFVGTTGGLKGDTVLFVSENIHSKLYEVSECGRNSNIPIVPAKLEAYRALFCSASQRLISPNKILVVRDCIVEFKDDVINIDDSYDGLEPIMELRKDVKLENNVSDGFNLCTIEYMKKIQNKLNLDYTPSGVCLRNAWLKGMLYPFPILEFFEKYNNGNYMVKDIWGDYIDIREVEMILTESSLKLWSSYSSINHYIESYKKYKFEFSATKITPSTLEDERELNYQYLQSYDFSDDDIKDVCEPTVKYLKDSMCGDYNATIKFLGISGDIKDNSWQQALYNNKYMMNDPYIVDCVHKLIKKKINNAKIGKLIINGNYQVASGDPFSLMQSICGIEVTGILKKEECYSKYWLDKGIDEVCIFRSPMTSHNNIRKCLVNFDDEAKYWYKYMDKVMIINSWDTFAIATNGCDWDGDILYSTNNEILLKRHNKLPAIQCIQRVSEKIIPTENDIKLSNLNGMGNKVGSITNKVTNMIEVRSRFKKDSKEYDIMNYRMACGQLYQQNELDKIKGIDFKPMPNYWHNIKSCIDENDKLVCADKKPYFFIYIYDYIKKQYNDYIKKSQNKCMRNFGITLEKMLVKEEYSEQEQEFIKWYNQLMPIGFGECSMNKICWHIEKEFNGYKNQIKSNELFDYNVLKTTKRCTEKHRKELYDLSKEYIEHIKNYKRKLTMAKIGKVELESSDFSGEESNVKRIYFKEEFKKKAIAICPNNEERLNIILDMCYGCKNNRQFCWDIVGDLIIKRLEDLNLDEINNEREKISK